MAAVKHSKQRQSIKEYLMNTKEHPTADMVYTQVRKFYPNISLGTVYRNLNFLVDQGEAIRLTCGDGSERYDGTTSPHYHLVCSGCGRVFDLKMSPLDHINTLAAAGFDGTIEGHTVLFHGHCPEWSKLVNITTNLTYKLCHNLNSFRTEKIISFLKIKIVIVTDIDDT